MTFYRGASLNAINQDLTGNFFSDSGGRVNRIADRLFVGEAVDHDGKQTPVSSTWVNTVSSGIYEYLESNAVLNAPARGAGIGIFSAARSSTGAGTAASASIGVAAFGYNDHASGTPGVWGLYSTVIRKVGASGPTHGLEVDVANMGTNVQIAPYSIFADGQTNGLWICTGGETTNVDTVGVASCAIGIVQNDATLNATFDKGVVFHNRAINGTDGATGSGVAMALATGHQFTWYNNSGGAAGNIGAAAGVTAAQGTSLVFSSAGLLVNKLSDGTTQFQVAPVASAANRLQVQAGIVSAPPVLTVDGSDTNCDLWLRPKGTGVMRMGVTYTAGAVAQTGYVQMKDDAGTLRRFLIG